MLKADSLDYIFVTDTLGLT